MHFKTLVVLLASSVAGGVACSNHRNLGDTDPNGIGDVDAGARDVPSSVDMKVVPDLPIADAPVAEILKAAACDELASAAQAQFESYLPGSASLSCEADLDCSDLDLQSLNCVAPCGRIVRTADVSTVTAAAADVCDGYFGAGCPAKTPPCPLLHAICEHGACATASGRGGSSAVMDAANDIGASEALLSGLDSSPVDGGSEGGGTVECRFPGVSQSLICAGGDYCMAFAGGPRDSGVSFACEPFPEACLNDRSCACVCSTAVPNGSYCAVRGQQCICSISQGVLSLFCAVP